MRQVAAAAAVDEAAQSVGIAIGHPSGDSRQYTAVQLKQRRTGTNNRQCNALQQTTAGSSSSRNCCCCCQGFIKTAKLKAKCQNGAVSSSVAQSGYANGTNLGVPTGIHKDEDAGYS